jgi:hypothetical protein
MVFFTLAALVTLISSVTAGPPCTSDRPQAICAWHIRPYSDNAYTWGSVCGVTAPSNALIADNIEKYDYGYDWCDLFSL